jgi:RNA 3'-terminal phosphate cyclase (ATP)
MIEIDGAFGEGGGQIIRTSLSLSAMTGIPVRLINIRKRRKKPGLMRQHLTALRAVGELTRAKIVGDDVGSDVVEFTPGAIVGGDYQFDIGTAGSTTLVMQTVLWPLTQASVPSTVTFSGGTHNPLCPPFDFVSQSFAPALRAMDLDVDVELNRHGFAPAGGGSFTLAVTPGAPTAVTWEAAHPTLSRSIHVTISNLPEKIAQSELDLAMNYLGWSDATTEIHSVESNGPGNIVVATVHAEPFSYVASSPGAKKRKAEQVVERLADEVRTFVAAGVPVCEHLADQLIIPFALAGSGSFMTSTPTPHTMTQIEVVQKFLEVDVETEKIEHDRWRIAFAT